MDKINKSTVTRNSLLKLIAPQVSSFQYHKLQRELERSKHPTADIHVCVQLSMHEQGKQKKKTVQNPCDSFYFSAAILSDSLQVLLLAYFCMMYIRWEQCAPLFLLQRRQGEHASHYCFGAVGNCGYHCSCVATKSGDSFMV